MGLKNILTNHDFNGNQIKNVLVDVRSSDPGTPLEGQLWWNSATHLLKGFNGTSIVSFTAGGVSNAYAAISDGTTTGNASGSATLTFSGGSGLTATVSGSTVTLGIVGATGTGNFVKASSPTIVTPTIADFTNATHNHTNAAGGGTLTHAAISDFDTQVRTSRLDQMTAPTASVSMGTQKITNLLDPTTAQDAASKNYVDLALQGTPNKITAFYATTAALPTNTYANGAAGVGATLTGNSNAALTAIDGQTPAANDVILIKNEAAPSHNGLYVVTQVGSGSAPYILTRQAGMDSSSEFSGAVVAVEFGTTNTGSLWICAINAPTVGTTSITFTEINKAADLQQGSGITISGNTISVASSYTGSSSITTLGPVSAGTWQATIIGQAYGGSGLDTSSGSGAASSRDSSHFGKSATAPASATNVTVSDLGIPTMAKFSLTGNGSATAFTLTHNKNNSQPIVQLYDDSGNLVDAQVVITNANTVTVTFNTAITNTVVYLATVLG